MHGLLYSQLLLVLVSCGLVKPSIGSLLSLAVFLCRPAWHRDTTTSGDARRRPHHSIVRILTIVFFRIGAPHSPPKSLFQVSIMIFFEIIICCCCCRCWGWWRWCDCPLCDCCRWRDRNDDETFNKLLSWRCLVLSLSLRRSGRIIVLVTRISLLFSNFWFRFVVVNPNECSGCCCCSWRCFNLRPLSWLASSVCSMPK